MRSADEVIQFWFVEHGPEDWFGGKAEFDVELAEAFASTHPQVAAGEAWRWRTTPLGRLAEIVVLDQFSRQLHRGSPVAFAQDPMALVLAQEAIARGVDLEVEAVQRPFFYLPFMHSESLLIQDEGVRLYEAMDNAEQLEFMVKHREVITRFGRFPFRNKALGRQSTPEEIRYMEEQNGRMF